MDEHKICFEAVCVIVQYQPRLAKTTSRPSRRSGFCVFDQKPLVFGVFAVVFAQQGESAS